MAAEIFDKVNQLIEEIKTATPATAEEVEQFRIKYLGSKNIVDSDRNSSNSKYL